MFDNKTMQKLLRTLLFLTAIMLPNVANAITFTFEGRETQFCVGVHAIIRVTYNGMTQDFVTNTSYQTFSATFPDSAATTVSFSYINDYYNPGVCDRNIEMRNFTIGCEAVPNTAATITGCRWNFADASRIFMACPGDAIFNIPQCDVDLSVSKTVNDSTPVENQSITYTISVTNNSPSTATGFTLTDTLPAGVTYQSNTSTAGTVTP